VGLGQGAGVVVDLENSCVEVVEVVAGVSDEEGANPRGTGGGIFEMLAKEIAKDGVALDAVLDFVLDGELGIEFEVVKVFAHEAEAESVQGGDEGGVEQGALFSDPSVVGIGLKPGVEGESEPVSHFGGGGFVERDDEHPVDGNRWRRIQGAIEDADDEGARFAGAGAGHDQDVAMGMDGETLLRGGSVHADEAAA